MQFHRNIPGAPLPKIKGSQVPFLPSSSSFAGCALQATKNAGECSTLNEALVPQIALAFFPSHQHEHLFRSIDKDSATKRGTHSSSPAADGEFAILTPRSGSVDTAGLQIEANHVSVASSSAAPCAGPTTTVALPAAVVFPDVPAAAWHPAAADLSGVPASCRPSNAVTIPCVSAAAAPVAVTLPITSVPSKGNHNFCAARTSP